MCQQFKQHPVGLILTAQFESGTQVAHKKKKYSVQTQVKKHNEGLNSSRTFGFAQSKIGTRNQYINEQPIDKRIKEPSSTAYTDTKCTRMYTNQLILVIREPKTTNKNFRTLITNE